MTVRRRLGLVLGAFVVLMIVAACALTITIRARGQRSEELREHAVTTKDVARMRDAIGDLESGQRGFIATGLEDLLMPYLVGIDTVASLLAELRERHPGDIELLAGAAAVEQSVGQWRASSAEPEIALRRAGVEEEAVADEPSPASRLGLSALNSALDDVDRVVSRRFRDAAATDARLRRQQIGVLIATFALALALVVFTFFATRRWITEPLGAITAAAGAVRRGEIHRRIPAVGPPEIAELGGRVDEMRQRMLAEIERADRARQAVEQSASIVLQVQAVLTAEPRDVPAGWTVAAGLEPAEGLVAGDCYDIFWLGTREMAALVLDIAGHGASAALTALRCREIVRAALQSESDPGSALRILDQLTDDIEDDLFVTGFIAVIDHATGGVSWANAGHPPALLRHGPELIELPPTGPIVGPYSGAWSTERATIHPGGRLVMYTDGIPEARGSSGFFGSERLATLVVSGPAKAQELVTELLAEARSHAEGRLADDATAVVIARDEPESPEALPDVPATGFSDEKEGAAHEATPPDPAR